jgi:hypothetical protein
LCFELEEEESTVFSLVTMMQANPSGSRLENLRRDMDKLWAGLQPPSHAENDPDGAATNTEEGSTNRKQMVLHELGRATMAWMVVYAVLFFLLLGYKWQTKDYYQTEYERKLAIAASGASEQQLDNNATAGGPWWVVQGARMQEAMTGVRALTKLQDSELKSIMQRQSRLQEMRQQLDDASTTTTTTDNINSSQDEKGQANTQLSGSLDTLLKRAALAELPSSTVLNHLFGRAIADLKQLVQDSANDDVLLDWDTLQAQLSADQFPPKQPSVAEEGAVLECPAIATDETAEVASSSIPPENAARQSDLEEQLETIGALLQKRANVNAAEGLPGILTPKILSSLESASRYQVQNALNDIIKSATATTTTTTGKSKRRSSDSSSSSCLERDDILEIVEEGLLALQQQQNVELRNVLRKKAMELDPSTTSIILDADLPLPAPRLPHTRDTTNLGRLLDTPLILQLVSRGIDHLVELGGGYNDQLDHWLDSVAGDHGRESVGEMVVRQLLEESGKVEIPSVQKVLNERLPQEARAFLKKSKVLS